MEATPSRNFPMRAVFESLNDTATAEGPTTTPGTRATAAGSADLLGGERVLGCVVSGVSDCCMVTVARRPWGNAMMRAADVRVGVERPRARYTA